MGGERGGGGGGQRNRQITVEPWPPPPEEIFRFGGRGREWTKTDLTNFAGTKTDLKKSSWTRITT